MSRFTQHVFVRKAAIAVFSAVLSFSAVTVAVAAGSPESAKTIADWAKEGAEKDAQAAKDARAKSDRDQAAADSYSRNMADDAKSIAKNTGKGVGPAMSSRDQDKLKAGKQAAKSTAKLGDMSKRTNAQLGAIDKAEKSTTDAMKAEQRAKDSKKVADGAEKIRSEQAAKEMDRIKADDARKAQNAKDNREAAAAKATPAPAAKPASPARGGMRDRDRGGGGGRIMDGDKGRIEKFGKIA